MKTTVFTICWNEEYILPYFLRHYAFADRIFIYDNESDDRTREIATADPRVTFRTFSTGNEQNNLAMRTIKNQCWKGCDSDWVIVVDVDEFLDARKAMEQYCGRNVVIRPKGLHMIGRGEPVDKISLAIRSPAYDKPCCFSPKIGEINYNFGAHDAKPIGHEAFINTGILRHYAFLSEEYLLSRWRRYAARISKFDIDHTIGHEYMAEEQRIRNWYRQCLHMAVKGDRQCGPRLHKYLGFHQLGMPRHQFK